MNRLQIPATFSFHGGPTARSTWVALAIAGGVLAAVVAIVIGLWQSVGASEISLAGWIAMGFGVLVTLAVGGGLMALVFFSNRHGYDDDAGTRSRTDRSD